ncbi:hypothetical protein NQ317_009341 [Molorchus minor]|uniref:Uncharacterized protein n=1 Tax=Molorchus minor TaxID=1323400 RepID=A0ABQ9JRW3_9CUCU|nr:hypothetical protein NQ317_009341 [Molorchus minor]
MFPRNRRPLLKEAETLNIKSHPDVNGEQEKTPPAGEFPALPLSIQPAPTPTNNRPEWENRSQETEADGERVKKRRRPSGERSSLSSPAAGEREEIPEPPPSVEKFSATNRDDFDKPPRPQNLFS